jgi:hypothetical protein
MRAGQNETAGSAGMPGTPDNSVNPTIQVQPSSFPLECLMGNHQLDNNCTKSSPSSDPQLHPQGQTATKGSRPNITATHPLSICDQTGMLTDYDILTMLTHHQVHQLQSYPWEQNPANVLHYHHHHTDNLVHPEALYLQNF